MRVGFYLSGDRAVEEVLPLVAGAAMRAGERLLVVCGDDAQRARLDEALWARRPGEFLAHGDAGSPHDARQPILLSAQCVAANGAALVALADGVWREEAMDFDRAFLFFDDGGRQAARGVWRTLDGRAGVDREFHELADGRWTRRA